MTDIEQFLKLVLDNLDDGNWDFCLLLESKRDSQRWVQLTWDKINAAYPYDEEPLDKIVESGLPLFPHFEVSAWQPQVFATFEHGAEPVDEIAAFVVAYFEKVLKVSAATKDLRIEEQQL